MRWTPGPQEKTCPAVHPENSITDLGGGDFNVPSLPLGSHVVPEYDTNTSHCHPRRKGVCVACGQMTYAIAMDHVTFSDFYTMPAEVWSSRGIAEALRTEKQWTEKKYPARQA